MLARGRGLTRGADGTYGRGAGVDVEDGGGAAVGAVGAGAGAGAAVVLDFEDGSTVMRTGPLLMILPAEMSYSK